MAENIVAYTIQLNTENAKVKIDGLTKGFVSAKTAFKNLNTELSTVNSSLDKNRDKTGLAGAAVVEIGRTISDANYGFAAIANNISQLGSLMTTLIATSGGVKKGMQELGKAFAGPLGILIVFQVAITLIERFYKNAKKTEDALAKVGKQAGSAGVELKVLKRSIDSNNMSLEEKQEAIDAANKSYDDLNLRLDENGKLTDDSTAAIDNKILALERLAKANGFQKQLEDLYGQLAESQTKTDSQFVTVVNDAFKTIGRIGGTASGVGNLMDTFVGTEAENQAKLQAQITNLLEIVQKEGLVDEMVGGKDGRIKKETRERVKKLTLDVIGTTHEQIEEWKREGDSIIDKLLGAEPSQYAEDELKKNALNGLSTLYKQYIDPAIEKEEKADAERYRKKLLGQEQFIKAGLELQAGAFELADSEFQRQLDMEQNKTTALNNELNKRLLNENLSKDERRNIQNQIAKNDEALRIKQELIEKKRFKMKQAADIASATISTYTAAAEALKNGGGVPTGLPAMFATIATGLLQVASIARQKFNSSAVSASGKSIGAASSTEVQAPDFNVVGQSSSNQIASVIQSQMQKPIRTYVVSKDVSTAQEMDRNIVKTASLG